MSLQILTFNYLDDCMFGMVGVDVDLSSVETRKLFGFRQVFLDFFLCFSLISDSILTFWVWKTLRGNIDFAYLTSLQDQRGWAHLICLILLSP